MIFLKDSSKSYPQIHGSCIISPQDMHYNIQVYPRYCVRCIVPDCHQSYNNYIIHMELKDNCCLIHRIFLGRGNGLALEPTSLNPEGRGSIPRLGSRRSLLISIEHAELMRSTPLLVLWCAWLVTMASLVHYGLGQLSPLPTSGDDKCVGRIHRLRRSLQFHYTDNQSLFFT